MQAQNQPDGSVTSTLIPALKEWAIAIEALMHGDMILLLRKGGIKEERGRFAVQHQQVVLYPTYEHQQPHLVKPAYQARITPVESGWHPREVTLTAWAEVSHLFQLQGAETVAALEPFHLWNNTFVSDRLKWKPKQPLYVLLLRVHALPSPCTIPYRNEYGGCRSWIGLQDVATTRLTHGQTVLTDKEYAEQVQAIASVIETYEPDAPRVQFSPTQG
ncbi:DUF1802 family protein [Leptolyngbya sp. AN02str]|uniref:DUF1802 family protein n=1 Tax=Leptolyngbya sp. AN02str TaxID=3423363 RepID=UPI003D31BCAF